jgi:hypothetical protein
VWCMLKDIVCSNNPCTEDSLKESVQNIVSAVSPTELWHAVDNLLIRCDPCVSQRKPFPGPLNMVSRNFVLTALC